MSEARRTFGTSPKASNSAAALSAETSQRRWKEVLGAKPTFLGASHDRIGERTHLSRLEIVQPHAGVRAHAQAVEHGRDAGGCDLRVVRLDRGTLVPAHAGPWVVMRLQMIGVKLYEARQQVVALQILAGSVGGEAGSDPGDAPILDCDVAAHDLVGQHDAGVSKDHGSVPKA